MGSIVSHAAAEENSSSSLAHIPEELIKTEILTRLPVISIIRLRCVCKSWKHLSSGDPDFVKSHLTNYSMNPNNGSLIVRRLASGNLNKIHPLNSTYVHLAGSVNGLVCVYSHDSNTGSIGSVGLWNPAINHYKDIPIPPSRSAPIPGMHFCLGIGFDPIANDYKVIYLTVYRNLPLVAHVYSSNSDSWGMKSVTSTFVSEDYLVPCPTVVQGRPYWYNNDLDFRQHLYVMFFDIQDESFRLLPDIDYHNPAGQCTVLVNLRDSLAFLLTDSVPRSTSRSVDVYVFDEKCDLWTKNYTIGPITIPKYMEFLHCFRNGDLLFEGDSYIKLVGINPHTHAINRFASEMYRYDSSRINLTFSYSCGYVESLVSLKGMSSLHVKKVATDIVVIEKSF